MYGRTNVNRDRLLRILWRFTPEDDAERTDEGFIRATLKNWERGLKAEIVDVGE